MASKKINPETSIMLVISYFVLFAVNSLVIWLANSLFPQYVVLGTQHFTKVWSLIHSMGTLSLINVLAVPVIREIENKKGRMLSSKEWMIKYFIINFVGIWVIARFPEQLGLGISSFVVAVVLAAVLDFAQGAVMMQLEKFRKK